MKQKKEEIIIKEDTVRGTSSTEAYVVLYADGAVRIMPSFGCYFYLRAGGRKRLRALLDEERISGLLKAAEEK
jgi:hypothetical protein